MTQRTPAHWRTWLGVVFAAITMLLVLLLGTAVPVVLDVRPWLLGSGLAAGALLFGRRGTVSGRRGRATRVGSTACLFAAALSAYDLTWAYRTEEVSFTNGDVALQGTLHLPRSGGRHPAIVLVHGAGVEPRDEYRFYARMYARHGVAALAYDKRGSGASTGNVRRSTYQQFAADAMRAVEMLRQRQDIDAGRVGIWAISEGEWTGTLAAKEVDASFLVLISVAAMTPADPVRYETGALVRQAGFGDIAAREAADLYGRLSHFERTGEGRGELNRRLRAASSSPWFATARYLEASVPEYERVVALDWFPAWRSHMDFDALAIVATLTCPMLVQNGGADPKTEGPAANERIRTALPPGGNTRFTGVVYPKATHNIVEWRLPFGLPPPFFARGYLQTQAEWVMRQVGL